MAAKDDLAPRRLTKKQLQGERSRELLLDAAEELFAGRGYAGTAISDLQRGSGLPTSSIYWHFGSKDGLLASVMERGAERWFAAIPEWEDVSGDDPRLKLPVLLEAGARATVEHRKFMRLCYRLWLEDPEDPPVKEILRSVRDEIYERFRIGVELLVPRDIPAKRRKRTVEEMTEICVTFSDGCFMVAHIDQVDDVARLYGRLQTLIEVLVPQISAPRGR